MPSVQDKHGTVYIAWDGDRYVYSGYWDALPDAVHDIWSRCRTWIPSETLWSGAKSAPFACSSVRSINHTPTSGQDAAQNLGRRDIRNLRRARGGAAIGQKDSQAFVVAAIDAREARSR